MTRGRSLTATLTLAFGATTLAVFALVGAYVYAGLERQVGTQDDLDIVLAARHTRRLAGELDSLDAVRTHADRLTSQVLGNQALSLTVVDAQGHVLVRHNVERTELEDASGADASGAAESGAASAALADADADADVFPPQVTPVPASERITAERIAAWTAERGTPVRGVVTDAVLRDHTPIRIAIARNMDDRVRLLDGYRDKLKFAGGLGALQAMTLIAALPVAVIMLALCYSLWRGLAADRAHYSQDVAPATSFWTGQHWRHRLTHILRQTTEADARLFVAETVAPALRKVADEL
ncbi:heavy metal sensor signal transduction histidine kinase, partial [Burkholderia sp. TJI49]